MKKTAYCLLIGFLLLSLFCSCSSSHYTVHFSEHPAPLNGRSKIIGFVSDRETLEFLPQVNIVLEGTTIGTSTSSDGFYQIANIPPGRIRFHVSMIGYYFVKQFELVVNPNTIVRLDFELDQFPVTVQEHVIKQ